MALATPAEGFSQYTGVSLFKRENDRRTKKQDFYRKKFLIHKK
jgi:hypothetical protein